jgi:hypothetical protein
MLTLTYRPRYLFNHVIKISEAIEILEFRLLLLEIVLEVKVGACKAPNQMLMLVCDADLLIDTKSRELQILLIRVWAGQVKGTIHLRCIKSPVGDADECNISLFYLKQAVQNFERVILGDFCEANLIKHEDRKKVVGNVIPLKLEVLLRLLVSFQDSIGCARFRPLEGDHGQLFQRLEVWIDRFLTAQILEHQTNGHGLTAPWLAANEDGDSIDDARNDCENVLFEGLVDCRAFLQVHTNDIIILLAVDEIQNPLSCESGIFILGGANCLQELVARSHV